MNERLIPSRRGFLGAAAVSVAAWWTVPGAFADELTRTPAQTEGPFYPDKLPLDTDNDLLVLNDGITPAVGDITHLTGKILDAKGNPLAGAVVEIWQCDGKGVYLHTADSGKKLKARRAGFENDHAASVWPIRKPRQAPLVTLPALTGLRSVLAQGLG